MPNPYRIVDLQNYTNLPNGLPSGTEIAEISEGGSGSFQVPIAVAAAHAGQPNNILIGGTFTLAGGNYGTIFVSTSSAVTIALPAASTRGGVPVTVVALPAAGTPNISITAFPGENIGGQSSVTVNTANASITLTPLITGNWYTNNPVGFTGLNAVSPKQFGAIGDGNSHPLSTIYATVAAARAAFPLVPSSRLTSLTQEIDWAACQQAVYTAFGAPGSENAASEFLNRPLYLQNGSYVFGNDVLWIRNTYGGYIYGDGENVSQLNGNGQVFLCDGLWYTTFQNFGVFSGNASGTNTLAWSIDGNSNNTPGHTYATNGVQGNTFINVQVAGGNSSYALAMGFYAQSDPWQGSENQFINLHLSGASQACFYIAGFNALDNNFYGGDCQVYSKNAILTVSTNVNIFSMSFESTKGYTQVQNGGFDINFTGGNVGNIAIISGCRSESMAFLNAASSAAKVISCFFDSSLPTWGANQTVVANYCICQSGSTGSTTIPQKVRAKAFVVTVPGTTGGTEPTWPLTPTLTGAGTNLGPTITDGTVTWSLLDYELITGSAYIDISGFTSEVYNPGRMWNALPRLLKFSPGRQPKTANYTLGTDSSNEDTIFVDCTSGAVTITIPTNQAISVPQWLNTFTIIKTDTTSNAITVSNASPGFGNSQTTDIIPGGGTRTRTYAFGVFRAGQQSCFGIIYDSGQSVIDDSSSTAFQVRSISSGGTPFPQPNAVTFNVDNSLATTANACGVDVVGNVAGSGAALTVISTGAAEALKVDAKGASGVAIGSVSTGKNTIGAGGLGINGAGGLSLDTGTKTATASGGAATLTKMAGVITSESLTTAVNATYTLTLTNNDIAAADQVFASVTLNSSTQGTPVITSILPGSNQVVIKVKNIDGANAFNGTINIAFMVLKN